jgi:hypothetical protein
MGRTREDAGSVDLRPRHPETKEVIESKLIPWHLIQNCMVYINTLMIQKLLAQPHWKDDLAHHAVRLGQCGIGQFELGITFHCYRQSNTIRFLS